MLDEKTRKLVSDLIAEADIKSYTLSEREAEEMAGLGALMGLSSLDGEWEKVATIVKAAYIAGVRRGRAENQE